MNLNPSKTKKINTEMCGDRPRGGSKGVIPCSCNLALGGARWYLCFEGLSARTALQEWLLARGCRPRLRRRQLPAASRIGEGILPMLKREDGRRAGHARRTAGSALYIPHPDGGLRQDRATLAVGRGRVCHSFLPAGRPCQGRVCRHPAPTTGPSSRWRHQVEPRLLLPVVACRVVQQLWGFQRHSPPCAHRDGAEWSYALGRRRAGCFLHPACRRALTLRITLRHQLV